MIRPEFLFQPAGKQDSTPVGHIVGRWGTAGQVGLEVEVEGNQFPKASLTLGGKVAPLAGWKYWGYTKDGSLRGQDNAEYVLLQPIAFSDVPGAVAELSEKLKAFGSVLVDSNRTSVHVHVNVQEFFLNRLASFGALWFCFEEILTQWCGDHRSGNLFCLRVKDAPALLRRFRQFLETEDTSYVSSDSIHYAALNFQALLKFGSLEIRTMRGPTDLSLIQAWVDIIQRLYDMSEKYSDPREIMDLFSQYGPDYFFHHILGDTAATVLFTTTEEEVRNSLYEGVRFAQEICYCRDWDLFNPVPVKVDPFGRRKSPSNGGSPMPLLSSTAALSLTEVMPSVNGGGEDDDEEEEEEPHYYDDDYSSEGN